MEQSNNARSKLYAALDKFITSDKTRPQDEHTLLKYLTEKPYFIPPVDLVPIHEIEDRLDIVQNVQKLVRNSHPGFHFPVIFSSLFMAIPWEHLPSVKSHLCLSTGQGIYRELEHIHLLTTCFFQDACPATKELLMKVTERPQSVSSSSWASQYTPDTESTLGEFEETAIQQRHDICREAGHVKRNSNERRACLDRDKNACLVTGAAYPEAYHILPLHFDSTAQNMNFTHILTRASRKLLGFDVHNLTDLAMEVGGSDKDWDMLSLNPQVYGLWRKGLLAFKCLRVTPGEPFATIKLQFCWMPRRNPNGRGRDPHRRIDLDDRRKMLQDIAWHSRVSDTPGSTEDGTRISLAKVGSSRAVLSGEIIEIEMPYDKAWKMKEMIDLQWTMISILALSDTAGIPRYLNSWLHECLFEDEFDN